MKKKASKSDLENQKKTIGDIKEKYSQHPLFQDEDGLRERDYYRMFASGYQNISKKDFTSSKVYRTRGGSVKQKGSVNHITTINQVEKNSEIAIAKLMKESPIPKAIGMGVDDIDLSSARIVTKFFEHLYGRVDIGLHTKLYEALEYAYIEKTGWHHITWNGAKRFGGPGSKIKGDVCINVYNDRQVFPDPSSRDYFDMEWIILPYMKSLNAIKRLYPHIAKDPNLKPYDGPNEIDYSFTKDIDSTRYKDQVLVWEYTERASDEHPQGRLVVVINGAIIAADKANPYDGFAPYDMPVVPFYFKKKPNKIHGESMVKPQISPCKDLNLMASLATMTFRDAPVKILVPKGSMKQDEMNNKVAGIYHYTDVGGGRGPVVVQGGALSPGFESHKSWLVNAIGDISGVHDVSQGQLPTGGSQMSGSALKLLIDSEHMRQSHTMRLLKTSMQIEAEILLRMVKKYYTEKRQLSVVGRGYHPELLEFKGADIKGNIDIIIDIGSALDSSPSAKLEAVLQIGDRGWFDRADQGSVSARKVLKMIGLGETDSYREDDRLDEAKARWVVEEIKKNPDKPPDLRDEDNHVIHTEVLNRALKSPEIYRDRSQKGQKIEFTISKRMEKHKELALKQQQEIQQALGQPQGGPPDPNQGQMQPAPINPNADMNMSAGGQGGV